jgi:hypothetical protein
MIRRGRSARDQTKGQALTEFALVVGLFVFVVGAVIQLALILWTMNTVTQVARDTARWAATQSAVPCDSSANRTSLSTKAGAIARQLSLMAYSPGSWGPATSVGATPEEGVGADWPVPVQTPPLFASDCPPVDNPAVWFVRVRINHVTPVFLPFMQFVLPTCASGGFCVTSTAEIRMEPKAP